MSYFLCLAVPPEAADLLPVVFDKQIYLTDASNWPIGKITRGTNSSWATALLQVNSDSSSLVGIRGMKRSPKYDHTNLFIAGIQALLENDDCPALSFLGHVMHGYISKEEFTIKGEEYLIVSALPSLLVDPEEDVRYTISRYTEDHNRKFANVP